MGWVGVGGVERFEGRQREELGAGRTLARSGGRIEESLVTLKREFVKEKIGISVFLLLERDSGDASG